MSRVVHPGSRIPDQNPDIFTHPESWIPDPNAGVKTAPDPGSGSATLKKSNYRNFFSWFRFGLRVGGAEAATPTGSVCLTWQAGPHPPTASSSPPGPFLANQRPEFTTWCVPTANQKSRFTPMPVPPANQTSAFYTLVLSANQMWGSLCASTVGKLANSSTSSSWCMDVRPHQTKKR
jgi:hypothetical protein